MGDSLPFSRYSIQLQEFFSFPMAKRPKSMGLGASRKRYHVGNLLHLVGALNPGASLFNNKTPIRLVLRRCALMIFPRAVINLRYFYLGTATIYRGAKIRLTTGDPTAGFGGVRYTGPRANKQGMKPHAARPGLFHHFFGFFHRSLPCLRSILPNVRRVLLFPVMGQLSTRRPQFMIPLTALESYSLKTFLTAFLTTVAEFYKKRGCEGPERRLGSLHAFSAGFLGF